MNATEALARADCFFHWHGPACESECIIERFRREHPLMLFQFNPDPPIEQAAEAADREAAAGTTPSEGSSQVLSQPSAAADLDVEALAAALGAYWSADPDYKRDPDLEHDYAEELAAAYAAAMKERP